MLKNQPSGAEATKDRQTEKIPSFIQVDQYEEIFIKAYEHCLQTDDYYTDQKYEKARHCTVCAIIKTIHHINNLEHGKHNDHTSCEKCEAKIIKKRMIALLENKTNN